MDEGFKMRKELLIGCGESRKKVLSLKGNEEWENLVTLDVYEKCNPDVVHDLCKFPLPFENNEFDEIHAYDVLEHTGSQGDYKFFFEQLSEFYRILKPNGVIFVKCPSPNSPWAWGDPGHSRIFHPMYLVFLNQTEYTKQVGKTAMTDYRNIYKGDFDIIFNDLKEHDFFFAIRAIKPSRISS